MASSFDVHIAGTSSRRGRPWLRALGLAACILAAWQIAVSWLAIPRILLPSVLDVSNAYLEYASLLGAGLAVTSFEVLVSFAASLLVGTALGTIIAKSKLFRRAVLPLLVVGQSVPILAAAPLFVVWFGFDLTPKILIALLITFFPILMGTVLGLRSSDQDLLALARSMGFGTIGRLTKIEMPAALPYLFASLKVSATLVIVGVVVGEFVGSSAGLGYVVLRAAGTINTPLLFAALGPMVLIGLVLSGLVGICERLATPWRFKQVPEN
jgi:NitT/TauT family transport system permease protein